MNPLTIQAAGHGATWELRHGSIVTWHEVVSMARLEDGGISVESRVVKGPAKKTVCMERLETFAARVTRLVFEEEMN